MVLQFMQFPSIVGINPSLHEIQNNYLGSEL